MSALPNTSPRTPARPGRFFTLAALLAVALAFAQWGWAHLRAQAVGPAAGACWVWAGDVPTVEKDALAPEPMALYLWRDVELASVPAEVRTLITADESYLLYVNGAWIGAGQYRPDVGLDAFDVTPWLMPGDNRILIEARSNRGVGGVLAAVIDATTNTPLTVSDGGWRYATTYDKALFTADVEPSEGQPVVVWGVPPSGRWQVSRIHESRDIWFPIDRRPIVEKPTRGLLAEAGKRWRRLRADQLRLPPTLFGERTVFDFGRVIEAVPVVDLAGTDRQPALVGLAESLTDFEVPPNERRYLVMNPVEGAPYWAASTPIRFRYLEVFGAVPERRPFALAVASGVPVMAPVDVARDAEGVFGLDPLFAPSRIKQAILERIASDREARPAD